MQLWGGGEFQGPLSHFLTTAAYLYFVVFVFVSFSFHLYKRFEELTPIYIFCYGHKNAGLESAFVCKSQCCSLSSFFFSLSSLFHWVQKRREKRVVFYLNNCHQLRLFDGGARIIREWSWVPARQQVKQLTRHREGWHTVSDIRLGAPRCVCKNN